jgi:hypothetical protein
MLAQCDLIVGHLQNYNDVRYVTNNTCIYLRVKNSHIYMYRREEYIKNP